MISNTLFIYITLGLWLLMTIYWLITAKTNCQTRFSSELFSLAKLIGSGLVVYLPLLIGGLISAKLYPNNLWMDSVGIVICLLGVGLAVWARSVLGKNWSGRVMLQKEHHLITEGPYNLVRHPIYFGVLMAMFGSSLVIGQIFGLAYFIFSAFGLWIKSGQEEALLTTQFPNDYLQYKQKVKMLLPYLF